MTTPTYMDYSATTPVDERVAALMMKYLTMDGDYGNPASNSHYYGGIF
jgi:cysteine desulfurase